MIKKTNQGISGTSFQGCTITTSYNSLVEILGPPTFEHNIGQDKVNIEWNREMGGKVFTIYDWKEYRKIGDDELIEWHIGSKEYHHSGNVESELKRLLSK